MSLNTVDLFCGVGGFSIAFEKNNFKTVLASDNDEKLKKIYNINFPKNRFEICDISNIKNIKINSKIDVLSAGFPCQPFSIAGYRHGFKDLKGRGNVFFDLINYIDLLKPRVLVFENVKNLISHDKGNTFKVIKKLIEECGYHVNFKILDSKIHGNIPQNRERIYIVCFKYFKDHNKFEWPRSKKLTKHFKDFLDFKIDNNKYLYDKKKYKEIYPQILKFIKSDGSTDSLYQWRRKYTRKSKKGICPTLTANMGEGGHNVPLFYDGKTIRKLSPRECFNLQGFPKSYRFDEKLSDSSLYKFSGNAVTVSVVNYLVKEISKVLK